MIRVYKITVPSGKNDVYRTGQFHFGSAHRPVDGVDICRECGIQYPSTQRSVLLYAVMRQAVKVQLESEPC